MAWIYAIAEEKLIVWFENRKQNEIRENAEAKSRPVEDDGRLKARLASARKSRDKLLKQRKQVIEKKSENCASATSARRVTSYPTVLVARRGRARASERRGGSGVRRDLFALAS